MLNQLLHSPAEIIQEMMVRLALAADPEVEPLGSWPVYGGTEPDVPDECITVRGTQGRDDGRLMPTGERMYRHGFQVRLRARDRPTAVAKAWAVATTFDQGVYDHSVTLGGTDYVVEIVTVVNGPLELGPEKTATRREIVTINCLAVIRVLD